MKLGTLIDTLEQMPQDYLVHYDNGMVPGYFATWRGVYAEVTLCPQTPESRPGWRVRDLLSDAKEAASGREYEGWKGGQFSYSRNTPVWAG